MPPELLDAWDATEAQQQAWHAAGTHNQMGGLGHVAVRRGGTLIGGRRNEGEETEVLGGQRGAHNEVGMR